MIDWINHTVGMYAQGRLLEEHLNMREYKKAYDLSSKMLIDLAQLQMYLRMEHGHEFKK